LSCLRNVTAEAIQDAVDKSPTLLDFGSSAPPVWSPRTDGIFLTDNPQRLVQNGKVANIPFISGVNDDEGTNFALPLLNLLTNDQVIQYLNEAYFPNISDAQAVANAYSQDVTQGSPFNTFIFNAITPQYKRIAAIQGDLLFQAPRRFFTGQVASKQPVWSYLNIRGKWTPIIGVYHGSDTSQTYGSGELQDYLINFVNDLNPNSGSNLPNWPQYTTDTKQLLTLLDGDIPIIITEDTFRQDSIDIDIQISLANPL